MAATKNSDYYKSVCRGCELDDCVADFTKKQATDAGCALAGMVTEMVWRASPHFDHEKMKKKQDAIFESDNLSEASLHLQAFRD